MHITHAVPLKLSAANSTLMLIYGFPGAFSSFSVPFVRTETAAADDAVKKTGCRVEFGTSWDTRHAQTQQRQSATSSKSSRVQNQLDKCLH